VHETARPTIGMTFTSAMDPVDIVPVARSVESHGLDEVWVFEDCFGASSIPLVTAALAATSRIRVGIALAPVPLRNPALAAMEFATIARLYPSRFLPGIGSGVARWMQQAGEAVASPMTLLRESADAIVRLLRGEEVSVDGRYVHLDRVSLARPPEEELPLYIGAGGPRMQALAGELGAGTLLGTGLTDDEIERRCAQTMAAARQAGADHHEVVLLHLVATGEGAASRLDDDLVYWGSPPGVHAGAAGDAAEVAASITRAANRGVTRVSVMCTRDVVDVDGFVRFIGREVVPLVRQAHGGAPDR
jgi:5,10-methylenetetrahydromethanopterin reductase